MNELTPVLVVGAGPVGMVTALELAHHGVPCVLVERELSTSDLPRMDVTSARSMELLARLGVADDVRAVGVAPEHSADAIWSTGLDGEVITTWRLPGTGETWRRIREVNDGTQPSQPWQRLSQIVLEPVLRAHCERHDLIDLRCGWEFGSLTQDEEGVTSRLVNTLSGQEASLRSSYVVGCDGAGSRVRASIGVELEAVADLPELPGAYQVHFKSRDLTALHRHGRFWHYFAFRYVIIAQDEADTWTFHAHATGPGDFDPPPADPDAFVRSTLGIDLDIDKVLVSTVWRPKFLAARWHQIGRVALAGDSAHQMFPTGAYGMNTGVADAVDLGWKLAALVNGWGGPRLLGSYATERAPVGLRNLLISRRHIGVHFTAGELLREGRPLPEIADFLQRERGENEYTGVELGYRYNGSEIVWPEAGEEPPWAPQVYTPTTWPGSRAPSVLLADGGGLHDRLGPEFTLVDFTGDGRADPLIEAARTARLPLTHAVVHDDHARTVWERDLVLVRPDQHVAWRGDTAPDDPAAVMARVSGQERRDDDR